MKTLILKLLLEMQTRQLLLKLIVEVLGLCVGVCSHHKGSLIFNHYSVMCGTTTIQSCVVHVDISY